MSKINKNFLWTGDRLMAELHLRQPILIHCAYRPVTEHRERIQKLAEQVI